MVRPAKWKFDDGTKRNSIKYEICILFYITLCNIAAVFTWPSNDLNLQPQRTKPKCPLYWAFSFNHATQVQQVTAIYVKLVSFYQMCMIWSVCDPAALQLFCCSLAIEPSQQKHTVYFLSSQAASFTSRPHHSLSTLISTKLLIWLCTELFSVLLLLCHVFLWNE